MSSTEPTNSGLSEQERDELAERFFEERLRPIAETLQSQGGRFFPLKGSETASSYFAKREGPGGKSCEVEAERIAEQLGQLWANDPLLLELIDPLVKLAEQLESEEDATEDLEPYIYSMF